MRLGGQRVGISRVVTVRDANGDPVLNEMREPLIDHVLTWVDGCLFETQSTNEDGDVITTTTDEVAWCFLPVRNGAVPGVNGSAPTPVVDITSRSKLLYDGKTYQLRGDAVLEIDDLGREDHVFCLCERKLG